MTWQLIVENGKKRGMVIVVDQPCFWIGRSRACHLRPGSRAVSRRHCALRVADDQLFLVPGEGAAPTLVNGRPANQETELHPADQLQVGPLLFQVWVTASLPSGPSLPLRPSIDDDAVARLLLEMDDAPAAPLAGQETLAQAVQATVTERPSAGEAGEKPQRTPITTSSAAERLLEKYVRRPR